MARSSCPRPEAHGGCHKRSNPGASARWCDRPKQPKGALAARCPPCTPATFDSGTVTPTRVAARIVAEGRARIADRRSRQQPVVRPPPPADLVRRRGRRRDLRGRPPVTVESHRADGTGLVVDRPRGPMPWRYARVSCSRAASAGSRLTAGAIGVGARSFRRGPARSIARPGPGDRPAAFTPGPGPSRSRSSSGRCSSS